MKQINSETSPEYKTCDTRNYPHKPDDFPINDCYMIGGPEFDTWENAENECIRQALCALSRRLKTTGIELTSPQAVTDLLKLKLADYQHEVFGAVFMDTRHRMIEFKELFRGTIDGASVHPREVVKEALAINAAAVIFAHNHPSGVAEPSQADIMITGRLKTALALVDIRVLDHIIVSHNESVSLAQRGNL